MHFISIDPYMEKRFPTSQSKCLTEKADQQRGPRYGLFAMFLHWVMVPAILTVFFLGLRMTNLEFSPAKLQLYSVHKWIGVSVFMLGLVRLVWRLTHAAPAALTSMTLWSKRIASALHIVLYSLMLIVPLVGWLYSSASGVPTVFLGITAFQIPNVVDKDVALAAQLKSLHVVLSYLMTGLIALHVAAAIKHHFWDKDGLLGRRWPRVTY